MNQKLLKKAKIYLSKIFIFIFSITIISCSSAKVDHATDLIPKKSSLVLYSKNFKIVQNEILNHVLFKSLKNNYFIQDIKNKFSHDIDLFFFKVDFNINFFFNQVEKDFIVGKYKGNYYLIAAVNFKTKVMKTLFNLLPTDNIKDVEYNGIKYHEVNRKNSKVYFFTSGDYLVIANKEFVIKDMIDSTGKENFITENEKKQIRDEDIFIKYNAGYKDNPYKLYPIFKDISLKMNAKTKKISIVTNSN